MNDKKILKLLFKNIKNVETEQELEDLIDNVFKFVDKDKKKEWDFNLDNSLNEKKETITEVPNNEKSSILKTNEDELKKQLYEKMENELKLKKEEQIKTNAFSNTSSPNKSELEKAIYRLKG